MQALVDGQADDAEVDLVPEHALDDPVGGAGRHHQLDVGMLLAAGAQHRRQVVDQGRCAGADAHLAEPAVAVAPHRCKELVGLLGDALGVLDQLAAGGGGEGALAHPVDETHAEPGLELADLQADGWLRKVEPLGRAREAALRHDLRQAPADGRG